MRQLYDWSYSIARKELEEGLVIRTDEDHWLNPIGYIRSTLRALDEAPRQGSEGAPDGWLEVHPAFAARVLPRGDAGKVVHHAVRYRRIPQLSAPSAHRDEKKHEQWRKERRGHDPPLVITRPTGSRARHRCDSGHAQNLAQETERSAKEM